MIIDGDKLIDLLPGRRWFGAQGRTVKSARVVDQVELDEGPPALLLVIAAITFGEGDEATYQLLLHAHEDGSPTEAFDDPGALAPLGRALAHGETHRGAHGAFRFGGPGLDPMSPPGRESIRAVGAEQSNSSVVFDEKVILKLIRRLEPGPNPELELNRYLTNAGFEHIPAQVGEIFYERSSEEEEGGDIDLGIAQRFVTDAREGWSHTLDALHALYDSAGDAAQAATEIVEERAAGILDELEDLGEVTAALHVVLARPDEAEPGVGAEPIDEWDLKEWAEGAHQWIRSVLRANAVDLQDLQDAIEARIDRLGNVEDAGLKARLHGDYHLGQVLLEQTRGWLILDFEGEPLRSLEERRQKQSPLRDVAGMLRSLSYAASVALFDRCRPDSDEWRRLEPWADAWEEAARDRFLTGYLRTSHEGRFLPTDKEELATMLDAFEIEKALYEVNYELGHRPQWLRIPLRGVAKVIERGAVR